MKGFLNKFFKLEDNKTSIKTEVVAGATTFLTMSYILAINPSLLSHAGIPFSGVLTATVLVSAISSILMGLLANLPFALAPGMGINAFFTYSMVLGMGLTWQTALGAVFISGLIFVLMTVLSIREAIVRAIPKCVRLGVAAGIGLFLCLLGLKSAGLVVANPATMVGMGKFSPKLIIFILGLIFTIGLENRKIPGHLLLGIVFTTLISISHGRIWDGDLLVRLPQNYFAAPDFSSAFFQLDIASAFSYGAVGAIFTLLFTDMFDSISTFLGVASVANLLDENGEPKNMKKALFVDALATTISGLFGTSSATTYVESASGVEQGGRTGLTAVVTGLLFIPFLWLAPLLKIIPACATAPALVIVGFYMMNAVSGIYWNEFEEAFPAFMALVLIPFTFSISHGISWSLIFFLLLRIFSGRRSELSLTLWLIVVFASIALGLALV